MEQKKSVNLFDLMSEEDRSRVEANESARSKIQSASITKEWLGLSELGYYYGWAAIQAVLDDVITLEQANMLVKGGRKIRSGQVFDNAMAHIAATSTKKDSFQKIMKPYIDDMRVAS